MVQLLANNLSCGRGQQALFAGINFSLQAGELLQIKGKNGVGKTTLLRVLCGLLPPWHGEISWQGGHLAYVGHQLGLKEELSVEENLNFSCKAHVGESKLESNLDSDKDFARDSSLDLSKALAIVEMQAQQHMLVQKLSAGQKRRVALARLLLLNAQLWVLDEPFTSLDRAGIECMQNLLIQHVQVGGLVVFSSHQEISLPQVEIKHITLGTT